MYGTTEVLVLLKCKSTSTERSMVNPLAQRSTMTGKLSLNSAVESDFRWVRPSFERPRKTLGGATQKINPYFRFASSIIDLTLSEYQAIIVTNAQNTDGYSNIVLSFIFQKRICGDTHALACTCICIISLTKK